MAKFVEFYGVPGCGKTTISRELVKRLESKKVIEYASYYLKTTSGFFWRGKLLVRVLDLSVLRMGARTLMLILSTGETRMQDIHHGMLIFINYLVYKSVLKEDCEYIVCDEGIIQYIFSMYYDRKIKDNSVLNRYISFLLAEFPSIKFVFCQLDDDIIVSRIKNRENGQSRLDKVDKEDLKYIVRTQRENAEKISTIVGKEKILNVCTDESPLDVSAHVYYHIL